MSRVTILGWIAGVERQPALQTAVFSVSNMMVADAEPMCSSQEIWAPHILLMTKKGIGSKNKYKIQKNRS